MRKTLALFVALGLGVGAAADVLPAPRAWAGYCTRPGYPAGCVGRRAARPGVGAPGVGALPGAGAGAAGAGLAPRPGVGAYGAGAAPGVGFGAPGAGVQPYNLGGPANYPGRR
ncbi:hypothetical protein [Acidisoma sp. C75]